MKRLAAVALLLCGCPEDSSSVPNQEVEFEDAEFDSSFSDDDADRGGSSLDAAADGVALPVPIPDAFMLPDVPPGPCEPLGAEQPCYPGPAGTAGQGLCSSGLRTCQQGGWSQCVGATTPQAEACDAQDNDCDGTVDEGTEVECYDGPAGTAGVGGCRAGTQRCVGGVLGACEGQGLPGAESCDRTDQDCDGSVDEGACECDPGGPARGCYSGAPGTAGVGRCREGAQSCNGQGEFGPCDGEVGPRGERCDGQDDDCDGATDEGLSGAACSAGQGACRVDGQIDCVGGELACDAAARPGAAERCNAVDDDCDGSTDEDAQGDCALDNANERCIDGTCWVESCEDGFTDADRISNNGCEAGCVLADPVLLSNQGRGKPAVAFATNGQTVGVATSWSGGGVQFIEVQAAGEDAAFRYFHPERIPYEGVALAPTQAGNWGLAALSAGAIVYHPTNGQGGIGVRIDNLGSQATYPTIMGVGADLHIGYEAWRDGERRLFSALHRPLGGPEFLDRVTDREWVQERRTLYRFGDRQDFVGVARAGQELAVETIGDGAFAIHRAADIAGNPSWIHRRDSARVLWHTTNNRLGWIDIDFTTATLSAITLVGANILDPVGFRAGAREMFLYRTPNNQVRLGVFPNGDNIQNRDLTNLVPANAVAHDIATSGADIAVALVDADGSVWLVRGTCR